MKLRMGCLTLVYIRHSAVRFLSKHHNKSDDVSVEYCRKNGIINHLCSENSDLNIFCCVFGWIFIIGPLYKWRQDISNPYQFCCMFYSLFRLHQSIKTSYIWLSIRESSGDTNIGFPLRCLVLEKAYPIEGIHVHESLLRLSRLGYSTDKQTIVYLASCIQTLTITLDKVTKLVYMQWPYP